MPPDYDSLDAVRNENLMQHGLFSEEATFHICGHVNRHNCRIWADEQPNALQEWERDSQTIVNFFFEVDPKIYSFFVFNL